MRSLDSVNLREAIVVLGTRAEHNANEEHIQTLKKQTQDTFDYTVTTKAKISPGVHVDGVSYTLIVLVDVS